MLMKFIISKIRETVKDFRKCNEGLQGWIFVITLFYLVILAEGIRGLLIYKTIVLDAEILLAFIIFSFMSMGTVLYFLRAKDPGKLMDSTTRKALLYIKIIFFHKMKYDTKTYRIVKGIVSFGIGVFYFIFFYYLYFY